MGPLEAERLPIAPRSTRGPHSGGVYIGLTAAVLTDPLEARVAVQTSSNAVEQVRVTPSTTREQSMQEILELEPVF